MTVSGHAEKRQIMKILNFLIIGLIFLNSCNKQGKKEIQVEINKNIETLSILYLISDIGLNAHQGSLSYEAKKYFDSYKSSEVVSMFKQFNDTVGFPQPADFFLRLQEFPNAKLPTSIKSNNNSVTIGKNKYSLSRAFITQFIEALNKFYIEANIEKFINNHQAYYDKCIREVVKNLPDASFISTMENYYGKEFNSFTIIPSPILFPQIGFGIKVNNHDKKDIYYIAGPFEQPNNGKYKYGFNSPTDIREMSVHEFGHSFINPLTENTQNKKLINTYAYLYNPIETSMKNQGYSDWCTCVTEHLVRLGEIRIAIAMNDTTTANNLRNEYVNTRKFIYIPHLENEIKEYENNRNKYQTCSDFFPKLINSFSEIDTSKNLSNSPIDSFPASLMEMNKPDYLIKHYKWDKIKQPNLTFYFSNQITNDSLKNQIISRQKKNIIHISKLMQVANIDTLRNIDIWIFKDDNEKYLKTQVKTSAHCIEPYLSAYYNQDNAVGAHELGHILSQIYWGRTKTNRFELLLNEGFAFYVDEHGYFDFDFYSKAKDILKDENYRICNIVQANSKGDIKDKSFVSGAFVKYLIEKYGLDKFIRLWQTIREDESIFFNIYGRKLKVLESDFYNLIDEEKKARPANTVHIAGRGSVVRQLRILVSQFRVLRTGTRSEIRPATCTNRQTV